MHQPSATRNSTGSCASCRIWKRNTPNKDLEAKHPEHYDENSPSVRVGSDLNKEFRQVEHKYPMLSLGNTYSETEVREFYERVRKALNEDFEICCELKFDGTSISLTYERRRTTGAGGDAW